LRSNDEEILKSFLANDLTRDLFGEILGKIGRKGRRDFGEIFRVSGADATSRDSRVGDDCGARESEALAGMRAGWIPSVGRLRGWLGLKREDDMMLGFLEIDRAQRKTRDLEGDLLGVKTRALHACTCLTTPK
jgi:hypothetical protein